MKGRALAGRREPRGGCPGGSKKGLRPHSSVGRARGACPPALWILVWGWVRGSDNGDTAMRSPELRAHMTSTLGLIGGCSHPSPADDRPGLDSAGRLLLPRPVEYPGLRGGGWCIGSLCSGVSNSFSHLFSFPPSFLRLADLRASPGSVHSVVPTNTALGVCFPVAPQQRSREPYSFS